MEMGEGLYGIPIWKDPMKKNMEDRIMGSRRVATTCDWVTSAKQKNGKKTMNSWKTSKSKQLEPSTNWKFCFDEFPLWGVTSPPQLSCCLFFLFRPLFSEVTITSWWLNQPIWKICSSKWVRLPSIFRGENSKDIWNHRLDINRFRNPQVSINVTKLPGTAVGFCATTVSTINHIPQRFAGSD